VYNPKLSTEKRRLKEEGETGGSQKSAVRSPTVFGGPSWVAVRTGQQSSIRVPIRATANSLVDRGHKRGGKEKEPEKGKPDKKERARSRKKVSLGEKNITAPCPEGPQKHGQKKSRTDTTDATRPKSLL